jgi:hypothetical protein
MHELRNLYTTFIVFDDENLFDFFSNILLFPFIPDDEDTSECHSSDSPKTVPLLAVWTSLSIINKEEEEERKRMKNSAFRNSSSQAMVTRKPRPPMRSVLKSSPSAPVLIAGQENVFSHEAVTGFTRLHSEVGLREFH